MINQDKINHYIKQCSLFITDYNSIAFDFMFQNKPVLYFLLDRNETFEIQEKNYMYDLNDTMYFGNAFNNKDELINRLLYYLSRNFTIEDELKEKYESIFYYKENITQRVVEIINSIIEKE